LRYARSGGGVGVEVTVTRGIAAAAVLLILAGGAEAQTAGSSSQSQTTPQGNAPQGASQGGAPQSVPSQSGQKPAAKSSSATASGVTVKAQAPEYRSSIDRRSYNLSNDLATANGSLADALRNVPTLDVDPEGNLSIRGDTNVTILIDGQPAPMFSGPNRAQLLQQLPANQYERVEVMTNPSASLRPEGTGGVINLISKKTRGTQRTAAISSAAGTDAHDRVTASGTLGEPKLTLSGVAFAARQLNQQDAQTAMQLVDPASGQSASITSTQHVRQIVSGAMFSGNAAYTPDASNRLDVSLQYVDYTAPDEFDGVYRSSATSGPLGQDYDYFGQGSTRYSIFSGAATYTRQLGGDEHQLELHFSYNDTSFGNDTRQLLVYQLPQQPDLYQDLAQSQDQRSLDLKAEYKGPMPGEAKLVAGYELQGDDDTYGHSGLLGVSAAAAAVDPALTDRFDFTQWVSDLYATYQHPIGHFDVMPGLRLEAVTIRTDQITQGTGGGQSYFEAFPTLHIDYSLDQNRQLFASYSRRIERPSGDQLDPFRVYNNPLNFSQGNPHLAPAITDSYEAGYEYTKGKTFLTASLYYKDAGDVVSNVLENLGEGVTLNSYANVGHTRNAGLELTAGGQITRTLSYSAGGDASWNQIVTSDTGIEDSQAAALLFGHVKMNWTATPNDFVQLSLDARGRQITAQGSTASWEYLAVGYRHRFSDRLAVELLARDPFDAYREREIIDTPTLREVNDTNSHVRSIQLGFTYQLGSVRKAPQPKDFDFGGGGGGGAGGGPSVPE
jgi:outer membrane receptor protein involved in Fe transport